MNRLNKVLCLFLLIAIHLNPIYGQLKFVAWTEGYIPVTSYLGKETSERFNTFQFQLNGQNINYRNWSLSVRLISPIEITEGGPNRSGKVFPPDKISLRWAIDDNNAQSNLNTIGASRNDIILQNANEVMLIERSRSPIHSYGNHYSVFTLFGLIKIASGKYLDDYISPNPYTHMKYRIPLLYTLYDEQGNVLGSQQMDYLMQISPQLTDGHLVDVEPDYSFQISSIASDASLRFFTREDYVDGVSLKLENAVKINSSMNFELRVKALAADFSRSEGGTLPLSILSIQLTSGQSAKPILANPKIALTTGEQVALSGSSDNKKNAQYFHLNYDAQLTRNQVLSSKSGNYSVSLLYLLMPK